MSVDATNLPAGVDAGRKTAMDQLFTAVYGDLSRLAGWLLRHERSEFRADSSDLVHETYLRMITQKWASQRDQNHFHAVAAKTMRRILVDQARYRKREKRGGKFFRVPMNSTFHLEERVSRTDVDVLDDALSELANVDARAARLVEMRFFAGLTLRQCAATLGLSLSTVGREWQLARSWLRFKLGAAKPIKPESPASMWPRMGSRGPEEHWTQPHIRGSAQVRTAEKLPAASCRTSFV